MKSDKKLKKHKNNLSRKKINLVNKKKQVRKKGYSRKNTKLRNKKNKSKKKKKMKGGGKQATCVEMFEKQMGILDIEEYIKCVFENRDELYHADNLEDSKIKNFVYKIIEYIYEDYDFKKTSIFIYPYITFIKNESLDHNKKKLVLCVMGINKLRYGISQLKQIFKTIEFINKLHENKLDDISFFKTVNEVETNIQIQDIHSQFSSSLITIDDYLKIICNFPYLISIIYRYFNHSNIDIQNILNYKINFDDLNTIISLIKKNRDVYTLLPQLSLDFTITQLTDSDVLNPGKYNLGIEIEGCFPTDYLKSPIDNNVEGGDDDEYLLITGIYFKKETDATIVCEQGNLESAELILEQKKQENRKNASGYTLYDIEIPEPGNNIFSSLTEIEANLQKNPQNPQKPCNDFSCGLHYHISHKDIKINCYGLLVLINIVEFWVTKYQSNFMSFLEYQKKLIDAEIKLEEKAAAAAAEAAEEAKKVADKAAAVQRQKATRVRTPKNFLRKKKLPKKEFKLYSKINFFYKDTQKILFIFKEQLKSFLKIYRDYESPEINLNSGTKNDERKNINEIIDCIYLYLQEITKDFDRNRMQLTVVDDPNLIHLEFRGMYPIKLAEQTVNFKKLVMNLWQEAITETNKFLEAGAAGAE